MENRKRPILEQDARIEDLRALLPDSIPDVRLKELLGSANGNIEIAADAYYAKLDSMPNKPETTPAVLRHNKFIGEIVVSGWSTYKGSSPVKEGEAVTIVRSKKVTPSASAAKRARFTGKSEENTIVRFATLSGREVGRMPQEVAKYMSKLLDLELCAFSGQIKCYLRGNALDKAAFKTPSSNQFRPVFDRSAETEDERKQVNRTLALISIIRAVGLKPSRSTIHRMNMATGNSDEETSDLLAQSVSSMSCISREPSSGEDFCDADGEEKKEVTDDQLETIYKEAQASDARIIPMDDPDTMNLSLKLYQKRALTWMMAKESLTQEDTDMDMRSIHPLWEEYAFPKDPGDTTAAHEPKNFYFSPYSGELSLIFPEANSQERGGILADEMGLGKTIEILSLIHANGFKHGVTPMPKDQQNMSPTTLVVCPMSLLAQWRNEIVRGSKPNTITVDVYYGDGRDHWTEDRLCRWDGTAPDVLVTTYGTILSEWSRPNKAILNVDFWRVVLDEAHHIKNRLSKTSRACHAIKARRRWAVSGTPIQNKLEDLFSLARFLKHEPWANYTFWRTFITIPFEKKDMRALSAVRAVLEPLVLRRTKSMRDANGDLLVPLPRKEVNIEYLTFSPAEQDIYDSLYKDSKTKFSHFCAAGKALSNYASIFHLLLRLRQVSCHPYLVLHNKKDFGDDIMIGNGGMTSLEKLIEKHAGTVQATTQATSTSSSYGMNVLQGLLDKQQESSVEFDECLICLENVDSVLLMPCKHMACRPCVEGYLQKREFEGAPSECPICREGPIVLEKLWEVTKNNSSLDVRRAVGGYQSSSKMDALLRHLRLYKQQGHKTVVFSYFTSFLDLIEVALKKESISYSRLDGTLSQATREKVLDNFSSNDKDKGTGVFLISIKAGGVGLNLTAATRVIIMDPWWNFAVESQAIDRVHRLGQLNDVVVTRFIMKDTVEERILEIQNRKLALANDLYMTREDSKAKHLQDLQLLFG